MAIPEEEVIFNAARQIAAAEARRLYLDQACAGDAALRGRIDSLLRVYDDTRSFLQSQHNGARPTVEASIEPGPGTIIGPYKLIEQLGEGGMGIVFRAEQIEPIQRQVALKIIKAGMDSRHVIARFEAERQALALMDHPNIAKVIEAGATNLGRPYFVMELIEGVPITRYCDERQLTPKERLELFIPVCQAVQHAHQKGIIHRDLKPSNVMISRRDDRPVPKIIDFGVAKATEQKLTEQTIFTAQGHVVGTLAYMSPEQAEPNQKDIDTRSDIYSLGVLLYELLTGTTPFGRARFREVAWAEMLRMLREEEPPKPSTRLSHTDELPSIAANRGVEPKRLRGLIRGDLDWIVMKSLEKDRSRRYATANGLARDIEHFLNEEPVEARPPARSYRFQKFIRRNRGTVVAISLVLIALVGGIIGTSIGLWRAAQGQKLAQEERQIADRQRDRAERHYQRALAAVDRLLTRVGETQLAPAPHMDETRRRLLEDALQFYQGFLADEGNDPIVRREIGRAHGRIARIEEMLGRPDKAEEACQRAIEVQRALLTDQNSPAVQMDLAKTERELALIWHRSGRSSEAERLLRELSVRESSESIAEREGLFEVHYLIGMICHQTRQPVESEKALKKALEISEGLVRDVNADPSNHESQARVLNFLGILYRETQRLDEARKNYLAAREIQERLIKAHPNEPTYQFVLSGTLNNLGLINNAQDRFAEAEEAYRRAQIICDRLVQDHPDIPNYKLFLAKVYNNIALYYSRRDDPERAAAENELALKLHEELMRRYPNYVEFTANFAGGCGNQGKYLLEQKKWQDALVWYSKSIEASSSALAKQAENTFARQTLHGSHLGRARVYHELNQPAESAKDYRRTLELSEGERQPNYVNVRPRALAHLGEHTRAAAEAEAIVVAGNVSGSNFKELGSVMAQCSGVARNDSSLPEAERETLAERYAVRAHAYLTQAQAKGYFQKLNQITALRTDDRLKPVLNRVDFKKLLADLEAKLPASEKPKSKSD